MLTAREPGMRPIRLSTASSIGVGRVLILFTLLRGLLSLFAFVVSGLIELPGPCLLRNANPGSHTSGISLRLVGVWQRYDTCIFESIATVGYQPNDRSVGTPPLYPVLMRLASLPLGRDVTLGGLVISGLAFIAAMTGLYRLVASDFTPEVAWRTILFQSVFPTAFFYFAPYSEALFLALAVWTLYAARRGAWGWAGLGAALIGVTRIQGALMVVPLAWEAVRRWRCQAEDRRGLTGALIASGLPAISFLGFQVFAKYLSGMTTYEAQRGWGIRFQTPWAAIMASWRFVRGDDAPIEALNLASVLVFVALLVLGARKLPSTYTLYALLPLLLIVSRVNNLTPLTSSMRYVLVLFPAFVVLALQLSRRILSYLWISASSVLLLFLFLIFLGGAFVG